ncbi:MAG: phytanoyl-CoA dioxygenase family protein [Planctomycetes bacterium]|nr:phytanoyl-CoA dioxygenase family protein [Planctomycetota bacterium]
MTTLTLPAAPTEAEQAAISFRFDRDGFCPLPNVLTPDECAALRDALDRAFANPGLADTHNRYGDIVMCRLFELDPLFLELLTREPFISLAERILGPHCHLLANNAVVNPSGKAIDGWHVDEHLLFPLPEGIERHDARLRMPICQFTFQILLSDVLDEPHGPTQFVPASHYAGRHPPPKTEAPQFDGRGPVSMYARAGDAYLHNGQCWHRGAPNTSGDTRYLLQMHFGMRWIAQRFYPFMHYRLPEWVEARTRDDARLRRVLGFHGKGPYG